MNDERVLSCAAVPAPHVLYSIDSSKGTPDKLRKPAFNKTANGVLQPMVPLLNSSHHVNFGYKLIHSCKVVKEWQVQSLEHPTVNSTESREIEEALAFQFSQTYKFKGPCSTKSLEVKIGVE